MSIDKNYIELVGAYLDNELSPEEMEQFRTELAQNPTLQEELNFHNDLIEGIKANRTAELKARLDTVPIPSGGLGGVASTTTFKVVSGLVVIGALTFGVLKVMDSQSPQTDPAEVDTEVIDPADPDDTSVITESTSDVPIPTQQRPEDGQQPSQQPQTTSESAADDSNNNAQIVDSESETPEIPQPLVEFDSEDIGEEDLDLPVTSMGKENVSDEVDNMEVEIVSNRRRYPLHYQMEAGKLILYGDFDESTYELLEIKSDNRKQLYLYFKGKYYDLDARAVDITPLQDIKNTTVLNELEKLRIKR